MEEQQAPAPEPAKAGGSNKILWVVIAILVVVVLVQAAALAGLFAAPPAKVTTLVIGTVLSKSGSLSAYGPDNENGTIMAVDEINKAGGVLGNQIQIFHQDDKTDPATAASAARTLLSANHVAAIVGATGSGQCSTVLPVVYNSAVEISASCTSPKFSNTDLTGGWFARTAPSDALQGVVAAYYAYHNLSVRRAAVIGINNAYGTGLATVFANAFTKLGGTVTAGSPRIVDEIGGSTTDYTTDLHAILDNVNAQLVYVVAYPPDGVVMMKNWWAGHSSNPGWNNVNWTFSEGLYDSAFIDPLVTASVDVSSFRGTAPSAYGGLRGPNYDSWKTNYTAKFGKVTPSLFTANAYDAVYLFALAAQAAGDASGASIKANLQQVAGPPGTAILPGGWAKALGALGAGQDVNYEGASGSVDINAQGDPFSGYIVWNLTTSNSLSIKEIFPESLVNSLVVQTSSLSLQTTRMTVTGDTLSPFGRMLVAAVNLVRPD